MRKLIYILLLCTLSLGFAQEHDKRISNIKNQLELLAVDNAGLTENVKTEISVSNITLTNFLMAVAEVHKININVSPELDQVSIVNNFPNVTVSDLLVFLCKEHELTIDFTGNILSVKKYKAPVVVEKELTVTYNPGNNTISIDAKDDRLYDVFKRITDETGKNLVFSPGMENENITAYFQHIPFDVAMDKMALANNLYLEKSKDNFYVFEKLNAVESADNGTVNRPRPKRRRNGDISFKVLNKSAKLLDVDFVDTPIAHVINDIASELDIDIFTATPLEEAGNASLKARSISFDNLLIKLFEAQTISEGQPVNTNPNGRPNQNNAAGGSEKKLFTFKKEGNIYYFGTEDQLSVRKVEIIYLQHRSVELLSDPQNNTYGNSTSNRVFNNLNAVGDSYSGYQNYNNNNRNSRQQVNTNTDEFGEYGNKGNALLSVLPDELKEDLDIKIDYELNSFYVNGPSAKVERFKDFVQKIDKPVPVVLIEVMIIEISRSATIDAGVSFGIGENPVETQGGIFPETNLTLGSQTVNKIIGSFNDFAGFNLGPVGPNFFATIRAMEANGDLKVRSTPRLATLNSHRAYFSNGQTSFYAVTRRNIYGTDNPQTSEITNYLPIDAELGLSIKPSVSGNGQVLLDISVVQSSFGQRVADDAPPDVNSRSFSSLIRMQDQDIAILGGLEEQMKNNSGSGVPLLSKIPVIKWLFSKRKREAKKAKLTVLIKPTVIY